MVRVISVNGMDAAIADDGLADGHVFPPTEKQHRINCNLVEKERRRISKTQQAALPRPLVLVIVGKPAIRKTT